MPFELKCAGAIYQRGVQKCLHSQLGQNVEAYIDDIVIKTRMKGDLLSDLAKTFNNLRKFQMKLHSDKCTFRVPSGKLLSFLVSHRGIEANPEKIATILNMGLPTRLKDMQKLTGCMAAFSQFITKLGIRR